MYTGTSADQDTRFSDKEKKLLKQMKFSESLNAKVDMNKVKLDTIKPWIGKRITELLGMEDDVVEEFVNNQLEADTWPDPRKMQINLTGFLNGKNARVFMTDLWELLLSAQESPSGIPPKFIEQKKEELKKKMEDQERVGDMIKKFEKDKEDREKERKKDRERRKSRSRSHTRDRRSRSRDRHRDKRDKEKERDKYKDHDSDKVREKHTKRDSRSKSKGKLVSNGHTSPTKKEKSRSCSPKNDITSTEEKNY
uniref:Serine/arginine repetitive matrix protein 1 n=1 Tax=Acyrthosiphon pisum TaxID=7029 RepID=C4WTT8_ACYPI|nr:ACYPI001601 [Acyrthosiphon pisum]